MYPTPDHLFEGNEYKYDHSRVSLQGRISKNLHWQSQAIGANIYLPSYGLDAASHFSAGVVLYI